MKYGYRTPSITKSIAARTHGARTRAIKRDIIPGYGKRGIGWVKDPKRAAYNKLYRTVKF